MANQKEYKIIINGINESIEGIGTLQDSLDKLGKKVEESGGHFKTASKSMDELAKTEEQIKNYNEEYATALAANKAVLSDHNKEVKAKLDLEKAEITVQNDLRDTYAQKQQLLTAMGKVIKNTAGDTSELQAKYAELNQELKDFDASLGNHQRNVGDYEIATKGLKVQLKEMQTEMANMLANGIDKADPKFVELAKKAGSLKDAIGDAGEEINRFASDTKKLDDVINIAQSATAAFELYKGAMSAFGLETEGAVEAIQKLQGAMAIIQSLQTLQNTLEQNSATAKLFNKAMNTLSFGIQGTTKATKLFSLALKGIGLGLIIGLIATLVEHWDDLKKIIKDNIPIIGQISDKFNGLKGIIFGVGNAIKTALMMPFEKLGKAFMKLIKGDFSGAVKELTSGWSDAWQKIKDGFKSGVEYSRRTVEDGAKKTKETITKTAKETAKETKDIREKMLKDITDAEKKAADDIQKLRDKEVEEEKKRQEKLKQLRKKGVDLEYDYQKALLNNQLAETKNDEEKIKIKEKLIELDKKRQEEAAKAAAADAMGITVEELNKRLNATEEKWMGLNETQKEVLKNLQTQLETIKVAADTAKKSLEGNSTSTSGGTSGGTTSGTPSKKSFGNQFMDNETFSGVSKTISDAYEAYAAPIVEGLGDSIHMMMEFAIEEAENALEEAEEMHDEAVDKVSESKDRLSELNDKMKDSSGAQLEAYKTQMADEILLLQEREQEERRLAKEKEKREKELEKQKKKARKLELQQQLVQAIVSGALAVVNGLATQPFLPVGIAMGALAAAATAIQIATISKQISKLADGGLLQGKSHSQGGIPVGNTGIEVEGGEYVVNKRSTAKYLPLLQQINEEGARKKTVANQLGKMASGGELNYEKINSNMDAMNTAKIVTSAIEGIDMHPVVSVIDINRGQKNLTEVRQLAGASS